MGVMLQGDRTKKVWETIALLLCVQGFDVTRIGSFPAGPGGLCTALSPAASVLIKTKAHIAVKPSG